jgi:hypothetical protein
MLSLPTQKRNGLTSNDMTYGRFKLCLAKECIAFFGMNEARGDTAGTAALQTPRRVLRPPMRQGEMQYPSMGSGSAQSGLIVLLGMSCGQTR